MSGSTPADVLELSIDPGAVDRLVESIDNPALVRDDFAGPGGWSTGIADLLHDADLTEVALEWDDAACATRVANGHTRTLRADVAAYPVAPFLGRTVGYIGSPPCQTFSSAGAGAGRAHIELLCECVRGILLGRITYEEAMDRLKAAGALDREPTKEEEALGTDHVEHLRATGALADPRNGLILIPARVIRALLDHDGLGPHDLEWVALEQVPTARLVFQAYATALRELGWSARAVVLNAADYGVPQTRERVYVLASRVRTVGVPEPTHGQGEQEADLFGAARLSWVSMARALGWGLTTPDLVGLPRLADNGEAVTIDGTEYRARDLFPIDGPAQTLTEKGRSWRRFPAEDVELVNNAQPNAARRTADQPAPTITGGHDHGDRRFEPRTEEAGRFLLDRRIGAPDADGNYTGAPIVDVGVDPCPTLTGAAVGKGVWTVRDLLEERRAGSDEFSGEWAEDRPATVVASREIVQHPGATTNRFNDSTKTRNDGLRITEPEGAVLQGFPAEYAWQGRTKSKRWEQIGNVVCPPVARRVVAEVLGVEAHPLPWHAYAFAEVGEPDPR